MIYPVRECDDGHDLNIVFSSTQNTFHILCCNDSKRKLVLKKVIDFMFPALVTSMFACYFKLCAVVCSFQNSFFSFQKQALPNWEFFFLSSAIARQRDFECKPYQRPVFTPYNNSYKWISYFVQGLSNQTVSIWWHVVPIILSLFKFLLCSLSFLKDQPQLSSCFQPVF